LVVASETLRHPQDVRPAIINGSARPIHWGGCVFWQRWPTGSLPRAVCLAGFTVGPHSSRVVSAETQVLGSGSRPGFYRLVLPYSTSMSSGSVSGSYAFAPVIVRDR
jgi:hypothetical protein